MLLLILGEKVGHMLKEDAVEKLVQKEVKRQVENQVAQAINDPQWVIELENKITKFVQDRIVARFSNISTVPDLVETVGSSVEKMFEDGFVPNIEHIVDNTILVQAVDQAVENRKHYLLWNNYILQIPRNPKFRLSVLYYLVYWFVLQA